MRKAMLVSLVCCLAFGLGTANAEFDLNEALAGFTGKVPPEVRELKNVNLVSAGQDMRASGGPDDAGYMFEDSAEPGGPVYSWVEINGTGTSVVMSDDDDSGPLPLGFTFGFYDGTFSSVYVSSNGHLTFGSGSTDYTNDCAPFPDPGVTPSYIVAPMWDDFNPSVASDPVWYQSFAAGSCPWGGYAGACFVVEFEDFTHYGGVNGDGGTWEVILFDNDEIIFQYMDVGVESGSGASVGIANNDGSIGLVYSCDSGVLTDSLAIRWYVSTDFPDLELVMSADATDVPPGGQLTITLDVTDVGDQNATGVVVTDTLPGAVTYVSDSCGGSGTSPWTWNIGDLASGATVSCDIVVQVDACQSFTNTATVAGTGAEPLTNNTDSMTFNLAYDTVSDGSFEAGTPNPYWVEASTNYGTPLCSEAACGTGGGTAGALTGDWWSWFGGATADEVGTIDQDVFLTGTPSLSFYLWAPAPSAATARGTFTVFLDGTNLFQIVQGDAAFASYTEVIIDLTPYADDATHTLRFEGIQIGGDTVTFNLDDVTLLSCPTAPDADVGVVKVGESLENWVGTYDIGVTNYGPDDTTGVVVTDTLPGGVTYVGDNCGGSAVGQDWTWNLGALAVGTTVTCTIDVDITDYADTTNFCLCAHDGNDPVAGNDGDTGSIAPPPQPQEPAIPTLDRWGIFALILVMTGAAWVLLRRRG